MSDYCFLKPIQPFGLIEQKGESPCLYTPWSFVHFVNGCAFAVIARRMKWSLTTQIAIWSALSVLYELKDIHFSYVQGRCENSFPNAMADLTANALGFIVGYLLLINNYVDEKYDIVLILIAVANLWLFGQFKQIG